MILASSKYGTVPTGEIKGYRLGVTTFIIIILTVSG